MIKKHGEVIIKKNEVIATKFEFNNSVLSDCQEEALAWAMDELKKATNNKSKDS